jgi:cobyric acid synthase
MKIGLLYVKGALPAFENFGHLPTHLVNKTGLVNGKPAHKVLDGLIIPGGSIMESQSITAEVENEIRQIARQGNFILGMCSGFQLLSQKTDIGRKSPCPLERKGLGILDVTFHPMIGTDRVEAEIVDNSFLTEGMIGHTVIGFHCHTYGDIRSESPPLFYSRVKRTDYADNPRKILSGARNDEGNVVGTMVHASLDENPLLKRNILQYLDASEKDLLQIEIDNTELVRKMKREIGIGLNLYSDLEKDNVPKQIPPFLMLASTGSDSGKTFLTTGIVGALRRKGYKVGVIKVGPDIRDIVPSLYLNKEKMEPFSSVQIGNLGWMGMEQVLQRVKGNGYHLIILEGVMSIFTGLLNPKTPFSSAEIAKSANIPVIMVSACNKGGIESASVDLVGHMGLMDKMGIETRAVILNKVYDQEIFESAQKFIIQKTGVEDVWEMPKINLTERGNIPEVEIRLEEFCLNATKSVEKYLNTDKIIQLAKIPQFNEILTFEKILSKFNS